MPQKISAWLYRIARLGLVLLSAVLFFAFSLSVLPSQSAQVESYSGGAGSPDTTFIYSPADLNRMAEVYGAEGRQAYVRARFTFDLAFPLIYTLFLASAISWLLGQTLPEGSLWRRLNLLPLAAMLLDFMENICAAHVMAAYPAAQPLASALASAATPLKWLSVGGSFLLLIIAMFLFIRKKYVN